MSDPAEEYRKRLAAAAAQWSQKPALPGLYIPDHSPLESSGMVIEARDEPIRCWRAVQLHASQTHVWLTSVAHQTTLTAEKASAACLGGMRTQGRVHLPTVPDPDCSCGFYGVKNPRDCQGNLIAEVEFWGRVIEHERGYRAQYQRILSVRLLRPNVFCNGGFLCDGTPEMIAFAAGGVGLDQPLPPGYEGEGVLIPVCATHAVGCARVATTAQLAARLGTEVRWADQV